MLVVVPKKLACQSNGFDDALWKDSSPVIQYLCQHQTERTRLTSFHAGHREPHRPQPLSPKTVPKPNRAIEE